MDAGDYRKADMSATLLDYRSATHDDYRRDASARPEREQQIDKSVLYRWVLILLLQTCNALGFITVSPIMPFVQMQFFNKDPPNGPCKTDAQTDSPGCKARLLSRRLPSALRLPRSACSPAHNACGAGQAALVEWSRVTMWWGVAYGGLAFLFSPIVGRMSDAFGRRPLMIFSMVIIIQQNIFLWLSGATNGRVSLWYYWIFNSIPDFVFAISASYVADLLPVRWRGFAFGLNSASGAVCSIVGAWIVEMFNRETDFLVALIFRGSALFIAVFLLPESLPPEHREQFQWSVFNSVKQLSILTRSSIFIRLATVIFLGAVLGGVPQSLYLRGVMHLTVANNATLQIIGGVSGLFVQVIMIKPMLDYLGERATTVIGECSNGV